MFFIRQFAFLWLFGVAALGQAADWPTYQHDYARTGVATESLLTPLTSAWVHHSKHAPRPAWRGEAKWDGYNKVYDMKSRQIFDYAYHPVIVDGLLYYGSSADDKVYCLAAPPARSVGPISLRGRCAWPRRLPRAAYMSVPMTAMPTDSTRKVAC